MNKGKYAELFAAFGKAPMKEFLELLFESVPQELKKRLPDKGFLPEAGVALTG